MLSEIQGEEVHLTDLFDNCTVPFMNTIDEIIKCARANEDHLFIVEEKIPKGFEDIGYKLFNTTDNIVPGDARFWSGDVAFNFTLFYENASIYDHHAGKCIRETTVNKIVIDSFNRVIKDISEGAYVKLEPFNRKLSGLFVLYKEDGTPVVVDLMLDDYLHYDDYSMRSLLTVTGEQLKIGRKAEVRFIKNTYHDFMPYYISPNGRMYDDGYQLVYYGKHDDDSTEYAFQNKWRAIDDSDYELLPQDYEVQGNGRILVDNRSIFKDARANNICSVYQIVDELGIMRNSVKFAHVRGWNMPVGGWRGE